MPENESQLLTTVIGLITRNNESLLLRNQELWDRANNYRKQLVEAETKLLRDAARIASQDSSMANITASLAALRAEKDLLAKECARHVVQRDETKQLLERVRNSPIASFFLSSALTESIDRMLRDDT